MRKEPERSVPQREPCYKIRDDNPCASRQRSSSVSNSLLADGCVIEGTVENCVLFRGVRVKKGAVVRNCVLMRIPLVEQALSWTALSPTERALLRKKALDTGLPRSMFRRNHTV